MAQACFHCRTFLQKSKSSTMIKLIYVINIFTMTSILISCSPKAEQQSQSDSTMVNHPPAITSDPFGKMPDGREVRLFTLSNNQGMTMKVINYGGIIVSLTTPDKRGKSEDIVLGY